jgi:hypothetical protein
MTLITNEEKISILISHKKNQEFNKYNLAVSVIEVNSKSFIDEDALVHLDAQRVDADSAISALDAEIAAITPAPVTP